MVKNPPAIWETWVWSLGWEDPLEEGMASTPVFLPRESPWTEEPGRLQSMGSQRVGRDWVTKRGTAHPRLVFEWVSQSLWFGEHTEICCALCRGPQHVLRTLEEDPVRFQSAIPRDSAQTKAATWAVQGIWSGDLDSWTSPAAYHPANHLILLALIHVEKESVNLNKPWCFFWP